MPFKDILVKMRNDYFVIVTGVLFCQSFFCMLFVPEADLTIANLWYILIGGGIFTLPHLVFLSASDLSKRQWRIRIILHVLLLEVTVIGSGHLLFDWLDGWDMTEHVVMAVMILAVYLTVMTIGWKKDVSNAEKINQMLKVINKEEQEDVRITGKQ